MLFLNGHHLERDGELRRLQVALDVLPEDHLVGFQLFLAVCVLRGAVELFEVAGALSGAEFRELLLVFGVENRHRTRIQTGRFAQGL